MFKIGDRVRIKSNGYEGEIIDYHTKLYLVKLFVYEKNDQFAYSENEIELVTDTPQPEQTPFDIMPRYKWESKRVQDLTNAITRCCERKLAIPLEWLTEYNELVRGE